MSRPLDDELVSIVMPAYRAEAYIDETIESVIAQTYPHWELLVADDCSPDNTRERVGDWARKDPRVRLLALERNGGPALARNAALEAARGRWIAFLDSDDLWLPEKLEQQLAFHKEWKSPLTFTGFRRITSDGMRTGRYVQPPKSLNYRQALGRTAIATSSVIIDRAVTGDVRMKPVYYDDFACWLEILRPGGTGRGLDADFMRYRVNLGSVSRNKLKSVREVWRQLRTTERLPLLPAMRAFSSYSIYAAAKYSRF